MSIEKVKKIAKTIYLTEEIQICVENTLSSLPTISENALYSLIINQWCRLEPGDKDLFLLGKFQGKRGERGEVR